MNKNSVPVGNKGALRYKFTLCGRVDAGTGGKGNIERTLLNAWRVSKRVCDQTALGRGEEW